VRIRPRRKKGKFGRKENGEVMEEEEEWEYEENRQRRKSVTWIQTEKKR
jgi:hypothetical protein